MTGVATYDPHAPIGQGGTIIEASAGTGKTFTIAAAVTRLVAEEGIPLDRILVVTFTRAATAELKDRIRRRMVVSLRALRGDRVEPATDDQLRILLESSSRQQARQSQAVGTRPSPSSTGPRYSPSMASRAGCCSNSDSGPAWPATWSPARSTSWWCAAPPATWW